MSANPELQSYIEGSFDNAETSCHRVAALGPGIVPDLLRSELQYLKRWGQSAEKFAAGVSIGNVIEKIRTRGERLVKEIACSSPPNSKQVGVHLAQSSNDSNPGIRVLSILLCMQEGVPRSSYSQQVVQHFLHDDNDFVRIAAAVCMSTIADAPPNVMQASVNVVMGFLTQYIRPNLPEIENMVRSLTRGLPEGAQNVLIVASSLYYFVATR